MGRTVVSEEEAFNANVRLGSPETDVQAAPVILVKADEYSERLVKYIPPDVIGAFTAIEGIVEGGVKPEDPHRATYAWVVFAIILVATPFYLLNVAKVSKMRQIAISTVLSQSFRVNESERFSATRLIQANE
jgi:hypothetical protein